MDIFVLLDGLRLRDHLSHGEMSFSDYTIDENLAYVIMLLAVVLSHENPSIKEETFVTLEIKPICIKSCICRSSKLFQTFHEIVLMYHPLFHPLSFAKQNALFCFNACQQMDATSLRCIDLPVQYDVHLNQCTRIDEITLHYLQPFSCCEDNAAYTAVFENLQLQTLHR